MNDRPRILAVDADPSLLCGVSRLLRQAGYQVLEATSGEQGLRLAVEHRPDLLLVSVALPDVGGIEFCRQLKADQALAGSLVVLLSAIKTSSEDLALALECGADGYIVQPVPNREFLARVESSLRLQRTLAERDAAFEALQEAHDRLEAQVVERELAEQVLRDSEERLRLDRETLGLVNALNHAANRGDSLHEIVDLFDHLARDIFSVRNTAVYLLSQDNEYLVLQNLTLPLVLKHRIEELIGMSIPEVRIGLGARDVYAEILQGGKPRITNDSAAIRRMMAECTESKALRKLVPAIVRILNLRSVMSVPLVMDGKAAGLLDVSRQEPFSEPDLERFVIIAEQFTTLLTRKQAAEALRESEERYRTFVQGFRGIAFRGKMDFTPIFFHGAVKEITGYTEREFLDGKPRWDQVIHPEDLGALLTEDEERLHSIPHFSYEREYRVVRQDGQVRWVHEIIQNVCDDSGKPAMVQGAIYDITERKRAEEALRQERDRAQKYLDIAGVMFVALDDKGEVALINQKGADILGYEQEEIIGRNWFGDFLPVSVRDQVSTVFHRLMAGEIEPVEYHENPVLTKGGEERIIAWHNAVLKDDEGKSTGILTSGEDITERVRAERATRERQRYLEGVLSAAPDAIVTLDPQNRIEDWNSGAERLFGYQRQETIGQDIDCLIARDDILEEAVTFTRLVSGGRNLPPTETVRYRQDGSPVNVIVAGAPIVVEDELAGVVAVYTDITERKQAEVALQQHASQLALLNEIGRRVTAFLDLDEVLYRAAQLVQERFGFHHVGLFTKAVVGDRLVMRARAGEFASLFPPDHSVALGQGMVGWVGLHGETRLANDVESDARYVNPYPDRLPTRSELSVPIRVGDQIVGVLDLQSPQPSAFDPSDVTTNETLADWLGGAIQNARLFHETQQQLDELSLLFAASVTFSISLDLNTVLETTARQITAALQAERCAISLWDREQDALVTMLDYSQDLDPWKSDPPGTLYRLADYPISRRVVVDRQPVAVQADDPRADPAEVAWMTAQGVKSLVMVPLVARDQAIGLLQLMEVHEKRAFSPAEMRLVQTLANQTAAALENARLYDEARRRSRELALLNRVIAATAAGQAIEPILEIVCRELALAFDVPQSAAALFNPEKTEAVVVAEYRAEDRPSGLGDVIPMVGNPSVEWLLAHKAPLIVDDAQNDPRLAPAHDLMRRRGTVSLLLLPLMVDGDVVGSLGVDAIEPRAISPEEVSLASRVAEQVSGVLARARLREEHQQMEEQFHQAQKMEAVGRLAGGVAHDFNNLLTVIHLSARLLERKLRPEDPLWSHVQRVQDAGQRAAGLTRQLLAFSRQEIIEPQVLDLNQVLGELDKMLRRIIGEDVDLTLLPAAELWPVKIDPTQVEQIVINLAINARDAMPDGGKLTIETANVVLDEAYAARHVEVEPGEYISLTVSDNGVGMSDKVKPRIFEPFFTTKEKDKGTGLGLATVFGIVKQNRGHIRVYSELGRGTIFMIFLPHVSEGSSAPSHLSTMDEAPSRGSETLLLVEDEAPVRELTRDILIAQGYRVLTAMDGEGALQVAKGFEGPIHLLLADVVMPRLSGRALADQLRSSRPEMRVLFISGYTDDAIVHHGVLAEGTNFLSKPFGLEALVRKVRTVLDA